MTPYEQRKQERIDRLRERAEKKKAESDRRYKAARGEADGIPLGQPILVGHHSEKRHRAALKRIDTHYRKSFEADAEEKRLRGRAASAEERTAIDSDDPEALVKLREELAGLVILTHDRSGHWLARPKHDAGPEWDLSWLVVDREAMEMIP